MAMMAPLAIPLMIGGGALQAYGAHTAGQSAKAGYDYKAGVALTNKRIAEQNRDYAFQTGDKEASRYGLAGAQRMGRIKVAQSASGIDINSGSSVDVRDSQQKIIQADEKQIHENAGRRAYGFSVQAANFESEARLARKAGDDAADAGTLGAISSLIGSATSVASKWYQGSQSGLFGGKTDPWRGLRGEDVGSNYYSMA